MSLLGRFQFQNAEKNLQIIVEVLLFFTKNFFISYLLFISCQSTFYEIVNYEYLKNLSSYLLVFSFLKLEKIGSKRLINN